MANSSRRTSTTMLLATVLCLAASFVTVRATPRIQLTLDSVATHPGMTSTLRVWLVNPQDSIAGFQIWLKVNRPDFVTLGPSVDTTGTVLSGWEMVNTSSLGGNGYDLLLTGLRNDVNPPALPAYPPHTNRYLLAKIPVQPVANPDTLFEKTALIMVDASLAGHCAFSDQTGNDVILQTIIVADTQCFRCLQYVGSVCVDWMRVATPPCDSTYISIDTIPLVDTAAFHVNAATVTFSPCTPIPMVGDVLPDGFPFNIGDIILLSRYIAGDTSALPLPYNADLNGDCKISWDDYFILQNVFTYGMPYLDTAGVANCTCPSPIRTCCYGTRGNISSQPQQGVDLTDLSLLVAYMTIPGSTLRCTDEANINGAGSVDLSDLSILINYLMFGGSLPPCP